MRTPLVSFVMPVYNDEQNVARCLQSIKNQLFPGPDVELLVLDNGSTDGTPAILKDMGIPFHVVSNIHVSGLRNYGASMAHGEFLAFVDSDVEISPQWLNNALAVLNDHNIVACGCFPEVPPQATWVQQTWDLHQRSRHNQSGTVPVSWLPSMNLMVRSETFHKIGGFNDSLETAEDVDLCYRLGQHGTILNHPGMQAVHWGEAKDIATFWRKEVWRGMGNLAGVFSHGLRRDELPSLLYPLYIICVMFLIIVGCIVDVTRGEIFWMSWGVGILSLPALILALNTTRMSQKVSFLPSLFGLYFVYGLARATSVLKASLLPLK